MSLSGRKMGSSSGWLISQTLDLMSAQPVSKCRCWSCDIAGLLPQLAMALHSRSDHNIQRYTHAESLTNKRMKLKWWNKRCTKGKQNAKQTKCNQGLGLMLRSWLSDATGPSFCWQEILSCHTVKNCALRFPLLYQQISMSIGTFRNENKVVLHGKT